MFTVIHETQDFWILHKFSGVSFHRDEEAFGLMDEVREELKVDQVFPVHRIDKITSGIMLLAKNKETATALSNLFQNHQIEKYYVAISDQRPRKKQGLIKGDMVRTRRGGWRLTRTLENPAITQFFSKALGNGLRMFLLKPHTGRTHQIRVALKSLGAPAMGDPLYYKSSTTIENTDRGYLHAFAVRFQLNGKLYEFIKVPEDGYYFTSDAFKNALETLQTPWNLNWPDIDS